MCRIGTHTVVTSGNQPSFADYVARIDQSYCRFLGDAIILMIS